jgi:hypothetical protein
VVDGFKLDIPEFQGDLQPKELMDQVAAVGEVLDFKEVPEDRRVSLVATKLIDEDLSVDWASPPIYDIYPNEEGLLEEVNFVLDTINTVKGNDDHLVFEESPKSEISQWGLEIIYFLGIDNILFNDGFCAVGKIYMFTREKEREEYGKSKVLSSGVWGRHNNHQGTPLMKRIMIIIGRGLVVKLKREEWNAITGHPKDCGKDQLNSRTNSLQHGENDADQIEFEASLLLRSILQSSPRSSAHLRSIALMSALERTWGLMLISCDLIFKPTLFPCFSSIGFGSLYFIILLGLGLRGYLCNIFICLGFVAINICL